MVEPPRRIAPAQVSPRDYMFVLDVSGSMWGCPPHTAKVLMPRLIGQLRPSDTFNVMLFSGGSSVPSESSVAATPENLSRAWISRRRCRAGHERPVDR